MRKLKYIKIYKKQIQERENKIAELMPQQTLTSRVEIEKLKSEIRGLKDKITIEEDRKRMILSEYNKRENSI